MLGHYTKKVQGYPIPEASNYLRKSITETKPTTEKYGEGWFSGLIGENPMYPENSEYWSGYTLGYREYWCSKKRVTLSERFLKL